jgi:hypothetical protein
LTEPAFTTIMAGIAIPDVIYDPTIGRFISPDTVIPNPANPQCFNRYSYCLNNPLKYTDPSGQTAEEDYWKLCGEGEKLKEEKTIDVGAVTTILVVNQPSGMAVPQARVIVSGDSERTVVNIILPGSDESDPTLFRYTYDVGNNYAMSLGVYRNPEKDLFYDLTQWRLDFTTERYNPNPLLYSLGAGIIIAPMVPYIVSLPWNWVGITLPVWPLRLSRAYSLVTGALDRAGAGVTGWFYQTGVSIASRGACYPYNPLVLPVPNN